MNFSRSIRQETRMKSMTKLYIAVSILALFFAAGAIAQDQDVAAASRAQKAKQTAQPDPKPTYHADTQTFSCPAGFDVYADQNEAVANKPFVHCVKTAKTAPVTASAPASTKAAVPTLSDEPTYEEATAYIHAASAAGVKDKQIPASITKKNLTPSFIFGASKALMILNTGNYEEAESWLTASDDLTEPTTNGLPAMKVSAALRRLESKVISKQAIPKDCTTGIYVQLQLGHWWSTPKACDFPVENTAPKVETPAPAETVAPKVDAPVPTSTTVPANTVVAGYSLGMPFADFISTTTFRNKSDCDKNCQKVLRGAESGQETWFQTDKAKLCFEGRRLVEIDADGKTYRIN
jgi:hypothetical protein